MDVFFAATPIVLTLALLVVRMPAWIAPLVGALSAGAIALWRFDADWVDLIATWNDNVVTLIKVLAIIGGGVLLSRVMDRTGAQQRLAGWLSASGPTVSGALLMTHGVVPFFETVTGFGVALIIGLPLLLSFGFTPYRAAMLTLLGLMIGPWGSMGPGTLLGSQIANVPLTDLGVASGVVSVVSFLISGIAAAIIAGRGTYQNPELTGDRAQLGTGRLTIPATDYVRWIAVGIGSALVLMVLVIVINIFLGTPVAGASATLLMTLMWLLIIRKGNLAPGPGLSLVPYLILVAGTIVGQLLSQQVSDSLPWLAEVLASPALWAFTAALCAALMLPLPADQGRLIPREALLMWVQTAIPTALYILLGVMMSGGGLAEELALAFTTLGVGYLFLMPFLGGLSGYITASGTGGNAMFGATQVAAAHDLGISPLWTMAVQNTSTGWAIIASPARVELAYRLAIHKQTPDTPGPELTRGNLYRATLPIVLISLTIWGIGSVLLLPLTG